MRISERQKIARIHYQQKVNAQCIFQLECALKELDEMHINGKKFRSCNARIYTTENYVILQSYSTVVAVININMLMGFDVLRYAYGYTATSAQHISKFFNEYYTIENVRFDTIYNMGFGKDDTGTFYEYEHLRFLSGMM